MSDIYPGLKQGKRLRTAVFIRPGRLVFLILVGVYEVYQVSQSESWIGFVVDF